MVETPTEDIPSLRRGIRDLAALSTLPALWAGYSPQAIANGLADVLLTILNLDVISLRLNDRDKTIDIVRIPQQQLAVSEVEIVLNDWHKLDTHDRIRSVADPLGNGILSIVAIPIGYEGSTNKVIVGRLLPNTLTNTDLLLLRAAANQAAIALRQAYLLMDLKAANEQKDRLLEQEQQLRRDAEQAILARDEFLAVAAHELKTPLTSLRGFVQLLLRQFSKHGAVDPVQLQRALSRIDEQSLKLSDLLSQLLDLSRIEAGRLALTRKPTDIASLVQNVANTIQKNTERHSIILAVYPPLIVVADALRLEQVFINLLDNAIKYSPEGGPINIDIATRDEEIVQIAITDQGLGIPIERRQYIFDRFYQAHSDGYLGGMGLGLYISRQIIELHQGTLEAEFPESGGTRFIITLPIPS